MGSRKYDVLRKKYKSFCVVLIDKKMLIIGNVCLGYSGGDGFITAA